MLNSEKFLKAFNSIEGYLRKKLGNKKLRFYELVDLAAKSKPGVRRFENDLKEFGDLRNAIVHDSGGGYIIAEPNDRAVKEIERIKSLLLNPPKMIPLFKTNVFTLTISNPISDAVELIFQHTISQIPVNDGKQFSALLTTNTIARWLGACAKDDIFSLKETSVADVLRYTEDEDNYTFLRRNDSIFEALELFRKYSSLGKRLEAILITENGSPHEQIIGIMTVADLPKALKEIEMS